MNMRGGKREGRERGNNRGLVGMREGEDDRERMRGEDERGRP